MYMDKKIKKVEKRLNVLENDLQKTKQILNEIKLNKMPKSQDDIVISPYFTHSIKLPKSEEEHNIIILGSLILKNKGTQPLTTPYICLKFNTIETVSFSGRISEVDMVDQGYSPVPMQTWNYINEDAQKLVDEKGEYWLAPLNVKELSGGESLSFTNFQIRLNRKKHEGLFKVEGFVYGKELEEGMPALNKINVSL